MTSLFALTTCAVNYVIHAVHKWGGGVVCQPVSTLEAGILNIF